MSKIYVFKVMSKHKKSIWRKIEIKDNQSLGHFDMIIREAFKYDENDHLSEFFRGKVWKSSGFGEIEPGGRGPGAKKLIKSLGLNIEDKLEYVYDFGSSVYNAIELVKIEEVISELRYPRISGQNKKRNIYCERCKKKGKKEVALYTVYDFEDNSIERLCEGCLEEVPEDVDVSEIIY